MSCGCRAHGAWSTRFFGTAPGSSGLVVLDDDTAARSLEAEANQLVRLSGSQRVPCPLSTSAPSWFVTFSDATTSVDLSETAGDCGNLYNGVLTAVPTAAWRNAIARIAVLH
jgi:hypothetical protein